MKAGFKRIIMLFVSATTICSCTSKSGPKPLHRNQDANYESGKSVLTSIGLDSNLKNTLTSLSSQYLAELNCDGGIQITKDAALPAGAVALELVFETPNNESFSGKSCWLKLWLDQSRAPAAELQKYNFRETRNIGLKPYNSILISGKSTVTSRILSVNFYKAFTLKDLPAPQEGGNAITPTLQLEVKANGGSAVTLSVLELICRNTAAQSLALNPAQDTLLIPQAGTLSVQSRTVPDFATRTGSTCYLGGVDTQGNEYESAQVVLVLKQNIYTGRDSPYLLSKLPPRGTTGSASVVVSAVIADCNGNLGTDGSGCSNSGASGAVIPGLSLVKELLGFTGSINEITFAMLDAYNQCPYPTESSPAVTLSFGTGSNENKLTITAKNNPGNSPWKNIGDGAFDIVSVTYDDIMSTIQIDVSNNSNKKLTLYAFLDITLSGRIDDIGFKIYETTQEVDIITVPNLILESQSTKFVGRVPSLGNCTPSGR